MCHHYNYMHPSVDIIVWFGVTIHLLGNRIVSFWDWEWEWVLGVSSYSFISSLIIDFEFDSFNLTSDSSQDSGQVSTQVKITRTICVNGQLLSENTPVSFGSCACVSVCRYPRERLENGRSVHFSPHATPRHDQTPSTTTKYNSTGVYKPPSSCWFVCCSASFFERCLPLWPENIFFSVSSS